MPAQQASDYVSNNPDISPNPNPTAIAPVEFIDGRHVANDPALASEVKQKGTKHPKLH